MSDHHDGDEGFEMRKGGGGGGYGDPYWHDELMDEAERSREANEADPPKRRLRKFVHRLFRDQSDHPDDRS